MLAAESMASLSPAGNYDSQCEGVDDSCDMSNWSVDSLKGDSINGLSSSNRRKQTKPSRMSSNKQSNSGTGDYENTDQMKTEDHDDKMDVDSETNNNLPQFNNRRATQQRFSCQMCSLFFNDQEELEKHNRSEHEQASHPEKREGDAPCFKTIEDKSKSDGGIFLPSKYTSCAENKIMSSHQQNSQPITSGSNRDEDYCELCQKHFCNKYYLRKHKNDVHGITSDPPQNSRNNTTSNSIKKDQYHVSPAAQTSIPTNFPLFGQQSNPLHSGMFMPSSMFNPLSAANLMLFNPFAAAAAGGSSLSTPLMNPHFLPIAQPAGMGSPAVSSAMFQPTSPSVSASLSVSQASESNQNRNVRDSETFCDICRKELCNKYFLRTHKANKHGIKDESSTSPLSTSVPTPMSSFPSNSPSNMKQPSIPWQPHLSHTFSLNSTNNNVPKFDKDVNNDDLSSNEPENLSLPKKDHAFVCDVGKSLDLSSSLLSQQKCEVVCNICNKSFSNSYTLNLHFINAHHQNSTPDFLPDARSTSSNPLNSKGNRNSPPLDAFKNSMIAAKLADRVMCDICQKDLCNKYFLKTHKMKVHGVVTSSEDLKPGHSPSSNQLHVSAEEPHSHDYSLSNRANQLLPESATDVAYCELCKKDIGPKCLFASHMLSTHGVNMEMLSSSMTSIPNGYKRASSIASNDSLANDTHVHGQSFTSGSNQGSPGAKSGPGSSRWSHESPNQMRVMCDICDKWICNKYFLRTHKLKKHGISDNSALNSSSGMAGCDLSNHQQAASLDSANTDMSANKKQATTESLDATINSVIHKKDDLSPTIDDAHKMASVSGSYKSMYSASLDAATTSHKKAAPSPFMSSFFSGQDFSARPPYPPPMGLNRFMMPPYFDGSGFFGGDSAQAAMMMAAAAAAQYASIGGAGMPPLGLGATLTMPDMSRAETKTSTSQSDLYKEKTNYSVESDRAAMPVCSLCGLLCPDSEKLQKHIEQVHGGELPSTHSGEHGTAGGRRSTDLPLNLSLHIMPGRMNETKSLRLTTAGSTNSMQERRQSSYATRHAIVTANRILKRARRVQRLSRRPIPNRKSRLVVCLRKQLSNKNNNATSGRQEQPSAKCPFCCASVTDLMSHFVTHHGIPKHQLPFAAELTDHSIKLSESKMSPFSVDREARAFVNSFMQLNA